VPGRSLIRYKITQNDLAAMAGVARESVSRTFREWHRQKIVEDRRAPATLCTKASLKV
jgi:CRP/FNR family transcriptional regulator, cyclic AMP receptor protein